MELSRRFRFNVVRYRTPVLADSRDNLSASLFTHLVKLVLSLSIIVYVVYASLSSPTTLYTTSSSRNHGSLTAVPEPLGSSQCHDITFLPTPVLVIRNPLNCELPMESPPVFASIKPVSMDFLQRQSLLRLFQISRLSMAQRKQATSFPRPRALLCD